ncbi:CC172 protein, partial [Pitta sordida]|nr:CC172 protein [Pitta sordida]
MNLDALFQQIQFTEQQAREKRHLIQQAKCDINRSYEKLNQIKGELSAAKINLETKVQRLSEKQFYLEILKKREDSLEKQKAELFNQKSTLLKILTDSKRKITEEEDNFTREVTEFNNEYGLTSNRDLLIKKKAKTEINDLENEAALLKKEMESMEHKNVQLNALQLQKNELKQDLLTLQTELKAAQQQFSDLNISLFLGHRLKKELEKCKDDNWESVCETLQTEIEILQM